MKKTCRTLFLLIFSLALVTGFSQNANPQTDQKTQPETSKKSQELRRMTNNSSRNWNFKVNIDEKALEANIERAVENALRLVETNLEGLEIHIEPIEINLGDLNLDIDPIEINIPDLDIEIEPIEIDIDIDEDIDIDIDEDFDIDEDNDDEWNEDNDDEEDDSRIEGLIRLNDLDDKQKQNGAKEKSDKEKNNLKEKSNKNKADKKEDKSKGLKKVN